MISLLEHDALVEARALLEATGDFRVLERLKPKAVYGAAVADELIGTLVLLDTETTGLLIDRDEVIQLAMVKLRYGRTSGVLLEVVDIFDQLREPSLPIPPEITALTGITPDDVIGHSIDEDYVATFLADVTLVVAHNAAFDRPFTEKHWGVFKDLNWGCSATEVDWRAEGFEGTKLAYILASCGYFHDGHRALDDVWALAEILARRLPKAGVPALTKLLERARQPIVRLWAVNAPFDLRHILKARGYRWNGGEGATPKAWYRDLAPEALADEQAFLDAEIYKSDQNPSWAQRLTARVRFSHRTVD